MSNQKNNSPPVSSSGSGDDGLSGVNILSHAADNAEQESEKRDVEYDRDGADKEDRDGDEEDEEEEDDDEDDSEDEEEEDEEEDDDDDVNMSNDDSDTMEDLDSGNSSGDKHAAIPTPPPPAIGMVAAANANNVSPIMQFIGNLMNRRPDPMSHIGNLIDRRPNPMSPIATTTTTTGYRLPEPKADGDGYQVTVDGLTIRTSRVPIAVRGQVVTFQIGASTNVAWEFREDGTLRIQLSNGAGVDLGWIELKFKNKSKLGEVKAKVENGVLEIEIPTNLDSASDDGYGYLGLPYCRGCCGDP